MNTVRLFIALPISDSHQKSIARSFATLGLERQNYKVVIPENIHITLKFIGEISVERLPEIVSTMQDISLSINAFDLQTTSGVGLPKKKPRVIALDLAESDKLARAFRILDEALTNAGICQPEHRAFNPHITCARSKKMSQLPESDMTIVSQWSHQLSWTVNCLSLFESTLTKDGPVHNELQKFSFS
jgi:RNA 2',3'-cyclic 3'-phosphodiesterase